MCQTRKAILQLLENGKEALTAGEEELALTAAVKVPPMDTTVLNIRLRIVNITTIIINTLKYVDIVIPLSLAFHHDIDKLRQCLTLSGNSPALASQH